MMKLLIGISSIDAALVVHEVRRHLRGCEVRYVSLLKCLSHYVSPDESASFCLPLRRCAGRQAVADGCDGVELSGHGIFDSYGPPPPHIYAACAILRKGVHDAMASFRPDAVIIFDNSSIVSRYLDAEARALGVPIYGFHVLFASDMYFFLPDGVAYPSWLRQIPLTGTSPSLRAYGVRSNGSYIARGGAAAVRRLYWKSCGERLLRLVCGYPSFTSVKQIAAKICKPFLQSVFAGCAPLTAQFDVRQRFVLVLLHHPPSSASHQQWMDLIAFSLAAVPDDCRIVLRPHPRDRNRERLPSEFLWVLRRRGVLISRPEGVPLPALLRHAHAVFTLSSSAGVEALKSGTMVFTYGKAYYTRPHMAEEVCMQDADRIRVRLASKEKIVPDPTAINALIDQLVGTYAVSIHNLPVAARRLAEMLLAAGRNAKKPEPVTLSEG